MIVRIVICVILLIMAHSLFAQERPEENAIIQPTERRMNHYVGLQVNQLLRNLISFGGTSTPITNPYLLVYSANSKATGWGFASGLGLSSIQTNTTDNFVTTNSKVNNYSLRFGFDKKSYLSHRWLTAFGWDILAEGNNSTVTSSNNNGTTFTQTIKATSNGFGTGPRVALNFQFHERLMIGTEASYYFKWFTQTSKTTITGGGSGSIPKTDSKLQQFQFTLPAVVFIIMKF